MADSTDTPTSTPPKKGGGIKGFIRKNKTLSAVVAGVGAYLFWKMRQEPTESGGVAEEVSEGETASGLGGTAELAAYEVGRAERAYERSEEEGAELEAELKKSEEKRKEEKEEREEEEKAKSTQPEPGPESEKPETLPGSSENAQQITIHGKMFNGATGSRIARTGKTDGGKAYVEYAITFPGRTEHWQYFTATGNWRQVKNSAGGAAGNNGKPSNGSASPSEKGGGGSSGGKTTRQHSQPKVAVAGAVAVSSPPPAANPSHPAAVNTGNKCVNGGVGGHTAPPGYHLFCQNGWIWRAPNN